MHKDNALWVQSQSFTRIEVNHSTRVDEFGLEYDQNRCPVCHCELSEGICEVCGHPESYKTSSLKNTMRRSNAHQLTSETDHKTNLNEQSTLTTPRLIYAGEPLGF